MGRNLGIMGAGEERAGDGTNGKFLQHCATFCNRKRIEVGTAKGGSGNQDYKVWEAENSTPPPLSFLWYKSRDPYSQSSGV